MLAIGRALMTNPRLLLLDEPTIGLSPVLVLEMARIIKEIHERGVPVVLVEQNRGAGPSARRLCVRAGDRVGGPARPRGRSPRERARPPRLPRHLTPARRSSTDRARTGPLRLYFGYTYRCFGRPMMLTKVQKWGNSQGLRFTKAIMEEARINVGDRVSVSVRKGRIIVEPAATVRGRHDLKALVSGMPKGYGRKRWTGDRPPEGSVVDAPRSEEGRLRDRELRSAGRT